MGFKGTGIVVLFDDGAQAPKQVGETHKMCAHNTVHLVGIKKVFDILASSIF